MTDKRSLLGNSNVVARLGAIGKMQTIATTAKQGTNRREARANLADEICTGNPPW